MQRGINITNSDQAFQGRGTSLNLPNRFDKIVIDQDPEWESEQRQYKTSYLYDTSKTIINTNNSPDIPFSASLNPYRGCEHGCIYCLAGETLILMADGTTKFLKDIRTGDEIYGTVRQGWYRRYTKTIVLAHWRVVKQAYRVTLRDGTELIAGADHRFLTERGWKFVTGSGRPHLTINNKLMGIGRFAQPSVVNADYKKGYLTGMIQGDALLASYMYERKGRIHGNQYQFRLALTDAEGLQRTREYLLDVNIATREFLFQKSIGVRKPLNALRTHVRKHVEFLAEMVAWPVHSSRDWAKGFLAGIFDAEGSYSCGNLRITNTDPVIITHICRSLKDLGFEYVIDHTNAKNGLKHVRLTGGLHEHLRFFHTVDPAIHRKRNIQGQAVKSEAELGVVSIEPAGTRTLFDMTTGTEDFIANGVVSHNCYARPTHEYMGLSAGMDFESVIFCKRDAPDLLRKELSKKSWTPQTLVMSGVTDCYQPIERKLKITRQCLEVANEFKNPVAIITKNHLVARDIDILKQMAQWKGCAVNISVTTLRRDLAGVMEPRASRPDDRLRAISALRAAGIPVGVMVAPIIPALTDEEIPAILKAVKDAGAQWAGYTVVRLPFSVKDLFVDWLTKNFPDRKDKILHRIEALRGGKLNDPRFGSRMSGEGIFADQIGDLFQMGCKKIGFEPQWPHLNADDFKKFSEKQMELF